METETGRSGRKGRGCLVSLVLLVAVVAGAAIGVAWWLTRPPALPSIPDEYLSTVELAATTCPQLNVPLLAAQIDAESKWNPDADSGQAQGIAQFYPSTWKEWGKSYSGDGAPDVWNPKDAIPSQAAYMCELFKEVKGVPGDPTQLALAAYNAGPSAVLNAQGIPQISETQDYVSKIESLMPKYLLTYDKQIGITPSPSSSASTATGSGTSTGTG
ncbi:lytic transglycosylase domain-containing protein [Streptantibioticus parmotrematis]|uniref:lytic transglycosylase domain-containing protein n=1 Tax=Streptantibioticus parmotrematis TaxID=2873249 RepID=UPI0033D3567D